jgi:hypothetical protein
MPTVLTVLPLLLCVAEGRRRRQQLTPATAAGTSATEVNDYFFKSTTPLANPFFFCFVVFIGGWGGG